MYAFLEMSYINIDRKDIHKIFVFSYILTLYTFTHLNTHAFYGNRNVLPFPAIITIMALLVSITQRVIQELMNEGNLIYWYHQCIAVHKVLK